MSNDESTIVATYREHPEYKKVLVSDFGSVIGPRGRTLKQRLKGKGKVKYYHVGVMVAGRMKWVQVHKLVLEAFVGPCPLGKESLHGPKGRLCNEIGNLSYGTHSENCRDKARDGTMRGVRMSPEQVVEARSRRSGCEHYRDIASSFDVPRSTVVSACLGWTWKSIPGAVLPRKKK